MKDISRFTRRQAIRDTQVRRDFIKQKHLISAAQGPKRGENRRQLISLQVLDPSHALEGSRMVSYFVFSTPFKSIIEHTAGTTIRRLTAAVPESTTLCVVKYRTGCTTNYKLTFIASPSIQVRLKQRYTTISAFHIAARLLLSRNLNLTSRRTLCQSGMCEPPLFITHVC